MSGRPRTAIGATHADTLNSKSNLADTLVDAGNYDAADTLIGEVLAARRQLLGDVHPATLTSRLNLGDLRRRQCRYAEAAQLYERSLALAPRCAATHAALGFTRHLQGKYMAAVEHYHKALGIRPDDVLTGEMLTIALAEEGLSFRPGQLDAPGAAAGGTSTPGTSAPMEA